MVARVAGQWLAVAAVMVARVAVSGWRSLPVAARVVGEWVAVAAGGGMRRGEWVAVAAGGGVRRG
ncbi:hypothetical protein FB390_5970 [Nocardia bhagyanarayanae]|uniref:Uncharacterized protein n=1 Tax=Nocardia bhagyanarayanae TaxID=1215925 RepID=A0A543EW69_9NOCA|nr:hypothetical protein FB390_5970 [Nocardia bhagyanarayanae]